MEIIDRTGEESVTKSGLKSVIIAYRKSDDLDIQLEDGTILYKRSYRSFKKGTLKMPKKLNQRKKFYGNEKISHIGDIGKSNNGQSMKIIAYRNYYDLDVEFEDGSIVTNRTMCSFKTGAIANPNYNVITEKYKKKYIGMTSIANNGMKIKIIDYHNAENIDVEFEDGYIAKNIKLNCFKSGKIKNPNIITYKIGEESISKHGLKMKIIAFRNTSDVDIEFEDGNRVYNKGYFNFKSGRIGNPLFKLNYVNESDNYFGYKIKFAFNYNNKKYYFAKKINSDFEVIMTLQEIYQRKE